jgi:hypothetical protein
MAIFFLFLILSYVEVIGISCYFAFMMVMIVRRANAPPPAATPTSLSHRLRPPHATLTHQALKKKKKKKFAMKKGKTL